MTRAALPGALVLALLASSCSRGELSPARERYNAGVAAVDERAWDTAITELLAARDDAGPDPELRYRAAFDLGVAYAGKAEDTEPADPKAALEALRQSASWFRDAVRLRPDDEDPRVNLELALHRARVIADRLNKGERGLEPQLDQLIEAQRSVRDDLRQLLGRIAAEGAGRDPQAFKGELEALAVRERALTAEVSAVLDLAADERSLIEQTPEDQRTPEQQGRAMRLTAVEHYLVEGRAAVADSRRQLRRLVGERAHLRTDAAVRALKRAREQLADPQEVLRAIAGDLQLLAGHTRALAELGKKSITIGDDDAPAAAGAPPWLTTEHLGERQAWLHQRTGEVHAVLDAIAGAADKLTPEQAAQMARQIAVAAQAAPLVGEAVTAMDAANTAIVADDLDDAQAQQLRALVALARALERFADLRALIELAYATQNQVVAELADADGDAEALATAVADNRDRLARMSGHLADELAAARQAITAAEEQAQQQGAQLPDDARAQLDAAVKKAELAESLRADAAGEVDALAALIARRRPPLEESRARAAAGLEKLEELRRLYFTLVQHIEQLLRDQSETRDQTASAQGADDEARAVALGPIADRQREHHDIGGALAEALAAQADQAAAAGAGDPSDPQAAQAAEQAQRLAAAVPEMQSAVTALGNARSQSAHVRDRAQEMSVDLEPLLADQKQAVEHLEAVLRALQPPQDRDQDQDQNQDQGEQSQEQISQQEAERRLQAIREREAERQKEQARGGNPEPVERDW